MRCKPKRLEEIANALRVQQHYLSKIMQTLARHEIVQSYKGHHGGYELRSAASEIRLNDIVRTIDGDLFLTHCVLGFPMCGDEQPCPAHSYWKEAKHIVLTMLNEQTVENLSKNMDIKLSLIARTSVEQHSTHNNNY